MSCQRRKVHSVSRSTRAEDDIPCFCMHLGKRAHHSVICNGSHVHLIVTGNGGREPRAKDEAVVTRRFYGPHQVHTLLQVSLRYEQCVQKLSRRALCSHASVLKGSQPYLFPALVQPKMMLMPCLGRTRVNGTMQLQSPLHGRA